jgi:hypothetical protein
MSIQFNAITENGQCALLLQKEQGNAHVSRLGLGFRFWNELFGGLSGSFDLRLEDDMTFAGSESFRRCAYANLFRPFGILVVWVLI